MLITKLILSSIVGSILVAFSYWLGWHLLPDHCHIFPQFVNSSAVSQTLLENMNGNGLYVLPSPCSLMQDTAPYFYASIRADSYQVISLKNALTLFYLSTIVTFSLSLILLMSKIVPFLRRLLIILLVIFLSSIIVFFSEWNWNAYPLNYVVMRTIGNLLLWLLPALAIAAFTQRKSI